MIKISHITFETKYSRVCKDYRTVILNDDEKDIVTECIIEKSLSLGYDILALAILPDYIHLLISYYKNNISDIVKAIKESSVKRITEKRKITLKNLGSQGYIWNIRYHYKLIYSHLHIINTIKYINNQRIKHSET